MFYFRLLFFKCLFLLLVQIGILVWIVCAVFVMFYTFNMFDLFKDANRYVYSL